MSIFGLDPLNSKYIIIWLTRKKCLTEVQSTKINEASHPQNSKSLLAIYVIKNTLGDVFILK